MLSSPAFSFSEGPEPTFPKPNVPKFAVLPLHIRSSQTMDMGAYAILQIVLVMLHLGRLLVEAHFCSKTGNFKMSGRILLFHSWKHPRGGETSSWNKMMLKHRTSFHLFGLLQQIACFNLSWQLCQWKSSCAGHQQCQPGCSISKMFGSEVHTNIYSELPSATSNLLPSGFPPAAKWAAHTSDALTGRRQRGGSSRPQIF